MTVRRHVYYTGAVQGVGFRYTVMRLAATRNVAGFVRNLTDGRVELVAEGPHDEILGLLSNIKERMGGYMRSAEVLEEPATGEFGEFRVAF